MTPTAAIFAATLLAVPFWPTTGRDGAQTTLQEVLDDREADCHCDNAHLRHDGADTNRAAPQIGMDDANRGVLDGSAANGEADSHADSEHSDFHSEELASRDDGADSDGNTLLHPCEVAGGCYVWDLDTTSPAIEVTKAEGEFALAVWLGCEVRGAVLTKYRRLADVPNSAGSGAMGQAQVMPLHAPRMASMGLDYSMEYHRVLYAFWMFNTSGPGPWSCKHTLVVVGHDNYGGGE